MKDSKQKILIADDDLVSRKLLVQTAEGLGYATICAKDGQTAFKILDANPDFAMLITDVAMPELSGPELIRIIRGRDTFATLPIIIISGVAKISEIDSLLTLGASRFLPKPINIAELSGYINYLINGVSSLGHNPGKSKSKSSAKEELSLQP